MPQAQDSSHPTGVAPLDEKTSSTLVRARERKANAALDMALHGADWAQIAEVLGYPTPRAARIAVEITLEKNLSQVDKQKMRLLMQGRYNALVQSVAGKALDPEDPEHLAAVGKYREITADVRRMWGLDAPQEVMVTNPTQREIDDWVGIAVSNGIPDVTEDDVVDAVIVEDDFTEAG